MSEMPSIDFPVKVGGRTMTASVLEEVIPTYQFVFRIRFSNGYEDLFYIGDAGIHGKKDDSRPYADAISMDIDQVIGLDPYRFYHVFQENIDGVITNIWVIEKEWQSKKSYAVYYNRFYRFELIRENDKWMPYTTAKIYPNINFELARKVGFLLDSLL